MTRKTAVDRTIQASLLVVVSACLGWLGGFAWQNRVTINALWYEASEQRYLTMAGEVGPVTYLVTHDDYDALEQQVLDLEGVLGVEIREYPDVAAIAFREAGVPSIAQVSELAIVRHMEKKFVPMICH